MTLKFGELEKVATDYGFIWYAETGLKSEIFGQVAFCLVSTDRAGADDETILLAERIARDIDRYVKEALVFLKDELWRGRFLSKGELDICEPYGIGVSFEGEKPLCLENLELSSEC